MNGVAPPLAEPPSQLWLDVDRPIQVRPRRDAARAKGEARPTTNLQMELGMVVLPPMPFAPPIRSILPEARVMEERPMPFGEWLLSQAKRPGLIGELAKAAKLDRSFLKAGTADAIRARFSAVGADGDAFEALEDAEREYDRAMR